MNLMNLNERVLRHGESICFVGKFGSIFRHFGVVSSTFYKTNASAAPKIQFIEVHLLHLMMITRTLLYKLMNLMNFNELRYYLRLLFAMDKRARHVFWLGQVHRGSFGSLKKVMTMKKIFFLLSALVLTGCGSPLAVQAAALGTPEMVFSASPAATATATVSPTPTVDWQGTAIVAQATADEARRLDTQATAQEKDRIQQQMGWTAQADMWTAQSDQATATAYMTAVYLTSTARIEDLTATSAYMTLTSNQMTATEHAPTQVVAMIDAKIYEEHGETDFIVRMFVLGALGVFLFGVGLFALTVRPKDEEIPRSAAPAHAQPEPDLIQLKPETIVKAKTDYGKGYGLEQVYKVPCSGEQLSELAERVILRGETLAVNNFEGTGTLFTRSVFMRVRNFLQANHLAKNAGAGSGSMILTETGEAFLRGWLERKELPHSYSFDPKNYEVPLVMSHEHDAHAVAHGGGV